MKASEILASVRLPERVDTSTLDLPEQLSVTLAKKTGTIGAVGTRQSVVELDGMLHACTITISLWVNHSGGKPELIQLAQLYHDQKDVESKTSSKESTLATGIARLLAEHSKGKSK